MNVGFLGYSALKSKNLSNLVMYTDKTKATKISLWDRFIDLFKSCKKQDVVNTFYNLIHGDGNEGSSDKTNNRFHCFEQLKRLADVEHQHLFNIREKYISDNESLYTFSIGSEDIVSFCSDKNGYSLAELKMAELPVVDNYQKIVHDYMKSNEERFLIDYPDTKTNGVLGGDELMDCSCFFLRNNDDIRRALFAHGLMNMDMVDILMDYMKIRLPNDNSPRGGILTVIHNSLIKLYKLDTDYM
ncbi:hypothetical protein [Candidatus Symbiopectobacterium sp. NZEC135]|uniref:hypothetical protein n=1 Tax=Candidatus Symbiopectobacterium sp. NZEC135 TaxID=2820471 RepID=UPI002226CE57|nr:hypothetical protein [Candidatus Symbiopectobacterium sp. NZEC135]MCW2478613.1 hypothetical protein [Candidatus Symbiopectobacterium sp. NZEC135]